MRNGKSYSEAGRLGALVSNKIQTEKKVKKIEEYNTNPKLCKKCGTAIKYEKRKNIFCSQSCNAQYNNLNHRRHGEEPSKCKNCGKTCRSSKSVYCSQQCNISYNWSIKKKEIEINQQIPVGEKWGNSRCARKYLFEVHGHKCSVCGNTTWNNQAIPLVMDHVDGNSSNWKLDNLRLVCGNCDMQLPTYKSKNNGNGRAWRRKRYAEGKSY